MHLRFETTRAERAAARNEAPWLAQCIHGDGQNPKPLPVLRS